MDINTGRTRARVAAAAPRAMLERWRVKRGETPPADRSASAAVNSASGSEPQAERQPRFVRADQRQHLHSELLLQLLVVAIRKLAHL